MYKRLNIPQRIQRKMVLDTFIELECIKSVVDFDNYKRLKKQQGEAFRECEKLYFPSKDDK